MNKRMLNIFLAITIALGAQNWLAATTGNSLDNYRQITWFFLTAAAAGVTIGLYQDGYFSGLCSLKKAINSNSFLRAQLLLKMGRVSQEEKQEALHRAIIDNKFNFVELLLKHGAQATGDVCPLRLAAVWNKNAEILDLLLKNGAQEEINKVTRGSTPLAASCYCPEIFFKLLQHGAEPFIEDYENAILGGAYTSQSQSPQISKIARLLYLVENSPIKDIQCKTGIAQFEGLINNVNNNVEHARIVYQGDSLQNYIVGQNNYLRDLHDELEKLQQFVNPIMTAEKQSMVVEILTSLTEQEKEDFRQVLCVRYQHTKNLLMALLLYEYFDDASALQMYCNDLAVREKSPSAVSCSFAYDLLGAALTKAKRNNDFATATMLEKTFLVPAIAD